MTTNSLASTIAAWRSPLAGWTLVGVIVLAISAALHDSWPAWPAGALVWLAAILLLGSLKGAQRWQVRAMFAMGVLGLSIGLLRGADWLYLRQALEANQTVIAMLMGVSFLRLVGNSTLDGADDRPVGKGALIRTLLGGHLIGSVINMSTVTILGDRLAQSGRLSSLQALVILRGFSTAAFWSPFFAAMGIALISAPGAHLATLVIVGLPAAAAALAITIWQIARHPQADQTVAYPLHLGSLWLPMLLAVLVMVAHQEWPGVSVLTLVTLISVLFAPLWVTLRNARAGLRASFNHIQYGLPRMGGEVSLFLAAAVMAAGVAALLASFNVEVRFEQFGANQAFVVLVIMIGLAMIGMHPVTTVALAGSLLMPATDDPNLLGLIFLMSWSLGVALSPFSGIQLALQSRYGVSARALLRLNRLYAPLVLAIDFVALHAYQLWLA